MSQQLQETLVVSDFLYVKVQATLDGGRNPLTGFIGFYTYTPGLEVGIYKRKKKILKLSFFSWSISGLLSCFLGQDRVFCFFLESCFFS